MTRERPILFAGPMVRAILAGTKTQTRRAIKPLPLRVNHGTSEMEVDAEAMTDGRIMKLNRFGQPGDRLWVREAWQAVNGNDRARHIVTHPAPDRGWIEYAATPRLDEPAYKWRPSIHMPRWASRITLEVTGVRVERLQDISIEDAKAEGAWGPDCSIVGKVAAYFGIDILEANPRNAFQMLWESINGPGSWDANPWVWCVEFRRLTP